jgi:delta-aminolevulinic acid dehydratase/porphobilinogen synthase
MNDHSPGPAVWSAPRIRPRRMRRSAAIRQLVAETRLHPGDLVLPAYQVSGGYAMVEAAAARGWISRDAAVLETLLSIRRAGASLTLTYWATVAAGWLR